MLAVVVGLVVMLGVSMVLVLLTDEGSAMPDLAIFASFLLGFLAFVAFGGIAATISAAYWLAGQFQ